MSGTSDGSAERPRELQYISTHWTTLSNPSRFVTRYGGAVRAYLRALLPTQDDADEVEQDFLLLVVTKGFYTADPTRGKFRHYLIACLRNAAFTYLRNRSKRSVITKDLSNVPTEKSAEHEWQRSWRECVLQNTWNALRDFQKRKHGNVYHAVLKASVEHSDEDSSALAARVTKTTGYTLTAETYRKQLSRARMRFAELLLEEVSRTISDVTPTLLEEELRDLDLLKYVQALLPDLENL